MARFAILGLFTLGAWNSLPGTQQIGAQDLDRILERADDLVMVDQHESADKTVAASVRAAKKAADETLVARATPRAKEIAEARTLFQAQKRVLETLARNPDDPGANQEMGKFLCFVKGEWDLGLRFLVKGSDPALKNLAEKDIAGAATPDERAALADVWYDLQDKEKSPLKKNQLALRAKALYESALPDAPPLVKARIEKRLESLRKNAPPGGAVDLLRLIDPKRDAVSGEWSFVGKALVFEPGRFARLQIPYEPPDEFDITVVAERKSGTDGFYVGLARGSNQFYVAIDDWMGTLAGIGWVDGKLTKDNETATKGKFLSVGKASTIACAVRKDSIVATVDGKKRPPSRGISAA
jgi:hypothetical protein